MTDTSFALDNYRLLGNSGLRVSPLCLGTMTFGKDWGWGADEEASKKQLDMYVEKGGNFVDTANIYTGGTSEEFCGKFIKENRDYFVLATKYTFGTNPPDPNSAGNSRKNMMRAVEASLKRLGTDYIDLYWLHCWDYRTPVEEVMRAADDLVRQGKILYFGFSDTPAWVVSRANAIAQANGWTQATALQIEYSLLERTPESDLMPMAQTLDIGVTPWSPLGGGVLTGKYIGKDGPAEDGSRGQQNERFGRFTDRNDRIAQAVVDVAKEVGKSPAQVAINWLLCQPGVTSPILGARTDEQLADNLAAAEWKLSEEHLSKLDEVSDPGLTFPHNFITKEGVQAGLAGRASVEERFPYKKSGKPADVGASKL